MNEHARSPSLPNDALPDRPTLIAVSALAYIVGVALHEHAGHALACVALGGRPSELGAFYVNCDDPRLGPMAGRLVALAGPCVSLLAGMACFGWLKRSPAWHGAGHYFLWLLGALGFMTATGYLLFSGVSGLGDLGTTRDGALHGVGPEWLVRLALTACGAASYWLAVRHALGAIAPRLRGRAPEHIRIGRLTLWISYFTGAAVYLAIGLRNPYGLVIVLSSALASSMGGTSGLLWMMSLARGPAGTPGPGLYFARSWAWVVVAIAATGAYAWVLGPTLRP
jgi:hypothetical protein